MSEFGLSSTSVSISATDYGSSGGDYTFYTATEESEAVSSVPTSNYSGFVSSWKLTQTGYNELASFTVFIDALTYDSDSKKFTVQISAGYLNAIKPGSGARSFDCSVTVVIIYETLLSNQA